MINKPFSDSEVEFFIETNGRLSAERALAVGGEFLRFVQLHFAEGELEAIEIVYLGRGSFRTRLMVILRDPATGAAIALAALALSGAEMLKANGNSSFAVEAAKACIESGAARCGFRSAEGEFFVERDAMRAVEKLKPFPTESTKRFSKDSSSGVLSSTSEPSTGYEAPKIVVVGVFDNNNGFPKVYTVDGSRDIELANGRKTPPEDRVVEFQLRGPREEYGEMYALEGWTIHGNRPLESFVGRMIEIYDGRAVTFETTDGARYTPVVPDDTLGWVPMGALVEVRASLTADGQLEIYNWRELDREEATNVSSSKPEIELSTYSGVLSEGPEGLQFKTDWGGTALVNGLEDGLSVPLDRSIEIRASVSRGSRGGMADPRLFIHSWRPPDHKAIASEEGKS